MKTANDYLQQPYARIVIPVEGGGFHAEILEFPGCFAQGQTVKEAYKNLENAARSWIEACFSQGQEIPEPSSSLGFGGRIALRLPRSIHRQAMRMADRDGTSLNQYLVAAISARVGADDLYNLVANRLEQRIIATVSNIARAAFYAYQYYAASTPPSIEEAIDAMPLENSAGTSSNLELTTASGR
jgi:predicted RNase H-like HicB family nuclease